MVQTINNNSQQIRTLSQLRDTLLPKLMSGEIRLNQDFKDERISKIQTAKDNPVNPTIK